MHLKCFLDLFCSVVSRPSSVRRRRRPSVVVVVVRLSSVRRPSVVRPSSSVRRPSVVVRVRRPSVVRPSSVRRRPSVVRRPSSSVRRRGPKRTAFPNTNKGLQMLSIPVEI